MKKILIIDDEVTICTLLNRFLSKHSFDVQEAYTGKKAIELVEQTKYDIILCDYRLGDMNGDSLLIKMKEISPETPIIIITGYTDYRTAVEVMKLGAYDYVTKPLVPTEILLTIQKALTEETSENDNTILPKENRGREPKKFLNDSENVVGASENFRKIMDQITLVAPTNYSVIIYGETGSGKEVIAHEIQKRSARSNKPFIAVDCGTLSKELSGSELFGHEKGAFTGAVNQKIGCFEIANGGTIFLDEIANLPYDIQASLLRVVQERKMRRVGGVKDIDLNIRIIIASNEDLYQKVLEKRFREDLFHRFDEFSIAVPPLRERKEDIMVFANHFLKITNQELNKNILGFEPEVEEIFTHHTWFGNLRELKNVVRRAVLLSPDNTLVNKESLPITIAEKLNDSVVVSEREMQFKGNEMRAVQSDINDHSLKQASNMAECTIIMNALKQVNFNKSKAAQLLNIDRKTLYNKLKTFMETSGVQDVSMLEE